MKTFIATVWAFVTAAAIAGTDAPIPTADRLLHDVVAQLPPDPITVSGSLLVRRKRGIPIAKYNFELNARWGETPARATYTILDSFGRSLESLTIIHGNPDKYIYRQGFDLKPAQLKSISAPIRDTDLSWMDLTLAFLWWQGGKVVGEDSVLTVDCYIVTVNAPSGGSTPYASVKLWISKKSHMMLQAEGFDAKGRLIRRLWVRSAKKFDDGWMIKIMEIQKYPAVTRTKLRVTEVKKDALAAEAPAPAESANQGTVQQP